MWKLAPALVTLRSQINLAAPNRSRVSDGTIGDLSHQRESFSDHNPDSSGTVCAFDITHGPYWKKAELDCNKIKNDLIKDKRVKYVIFQRQIWTPDGRGWHRYTGPSPHLEHLHISVTQSGKNNAANWNLPGLGLVVPPSSNPQPTPNTPIFNTEEDDDMPTVYTIHPSPKKQEENYLLTADMKRHGAPNPQTLEAWLLLYNQKIVSDQYASDVFKAMTVQVS